MKSLIPVLLLSMPLLAAQGPSMLPLETGNTWIYRESTTGETRSITVGAPLGMLDGRTFYRLRGYVEEPLWVREAQDGSLLYLDEETGEDRLLTSFTRTEGGWTNAPFRVCEQESQPAKERRGRALELQYRAFGCADAGILEELYEENIGMTWRIEQSIAGPRAFYLESARIGRMVIAPLSSGRFHVEVFGMGDKLRITLRLLTGGYPVTLRFPSSQRHEILIRNREGEVLWRWSDGRMFTQAAEEISVTGHYSIEETVSLEDVFGPVLKTGEYVIEGSILGGAYAATSGFSIYQFF
ncbi:MAG: hypothetical protein KJZ84_15495 [Bryobacteraceae bacterium]|nr:hypothetical protein [Bryobacteraceae bacterium]